MMRFFIIDIFHNTGKNKKPIRIADETAIKGITVAILKYLNDNGLV